jgi:hypothetical protein
LSGIYLLLTYAEDVDFLTGDVDNINKSTEIVIDARKEYALEVNIEKTMYELFSRR